MEIEKCGLIKNITYETENLHKKKKTYNYTFVPYNNSIVFYVLFHALMSTAVRPIMMECLYTIFFIYLNSEL